MSLPGMSDSFGGVGVAPKACPSCGASLTVNGGDCLNCLLQVGLDNDELEGDESFGAVLAEVNVPDTEWRLGNYQILEEIGRGGMGVIYRARQRHSKRIVALKRVLSYHGDSRETLERFRREAEAAASLDHPNILPIHEVGEADGLPFFTMKLATGGSLQQAAAALRERPRDSVRLMAKVARAVAYAHREGILHRDLKPGNILLDWRGEPLVSDFGLAKWIDASTDLTRSLAIFGTPGFIAPEQAKGERSALTPAADVYSLGAILFDLLAGRAPFLGEHAIAVIHQAAEKCAPKLRSVVPSADRDVETICAKCLERDPNARYRSAADLAEDLDRWLEGRPIIARPVAAPAQLWRWCRRNPAISATLATCMLLGAVAVAEYITSARLSAAVHETQVAQRSVAVLPVEDLDGGNSPTEPSRTVTGALNEALAATAGIHVKELKRDSVIPADPWRPGGWQAAGEATGARFILSATVRRREAGWRIAAHLIEANSGATVKRWLQEASSPSELASAAPEHVGRAVEALGSRRGQRPAPLAGTGGSSNAEAISYYERGKEFFFRYNLPDQLRAIESFRQAIELDPSYGEAYAMLSWACQLRAATDPDAQWLEEASAAATAALRLAPALPETYRAQGGCLQRRGNLRASLDPLLTAYELDPSSARAAATVGYNYELLGRPDAALRWLEKAARQETRPIYAEHIGSSLATLGQYEEARRAYETAAVFRPDLPAGKLGQAWVALLRGDLATARATVRESRVSFPRDPQPLMMAASVEFYARNFAAAEQLYAEAFSADPGGAVDFAGAVQFRSAIGFLKRASGRAAEAEKLLVEARAAEEQQLALTVDNPRHLYSLAATEAALGNANAALETLQKACAAGWISHRLLELDPRFDLVREHDQFTAVVMQLNQKTQELGRSWRERQRNQRMQ